MNSEYIDQGYNRWEWDLQQKIWQNNDTFQLIYVTYSVLKVLSSEIEPAEIRLIL